MSNKISTDIKHLWEPFCEPGILSAIKHAHRCRLSTHNGRRWLSTLGVPRLRSIFLEVFGHHTASNNGAWLRRKLAEPAEGGRGRAVQIRARDASAAIWTTGRVKGVSKVRHTHAIPAAALESHKAFCLLSRTALAISLCLTGLKEIKSLGFSAIMMRVSQGGSPMT